MSRSLCHVAGVSDDGLRLDSVLAEHGCYASRSASARAAEEGLVLVNGTPAGKKHIVHVGDAIVYEVSDDAPTRVAGEPIDLDIRYEDEDLIVLSKQAGLVCHPSIDHRDGTLVNALIFHCGASNLCNVHGEDDRLGIVHRLDRDTTGLMLAAKTDECGQALMDAIRDKAVDRRYLALCHGVIAHETGMIDAPIARHRTDRKKMAVDWQTGRRAVTHYTVLERFPGCTHIACRLETGRTHQIRVHMAHIGHPLLGDTVYGSKTPYPGLTGQCLHARTLTFTHPRTGEEMTVECPLPDWFEALLTKLRRMV